jgi:ribosomal protein S18 acetylase RimI-like enzyme
MQRMLMEARSLTNDWRYAHVGELSWTYFMAACHLNPGEHIRLWHNGRNKLVGYAVLGEDPAFDVQVHPQYEGYGIEAVALAWAEARLRELSRQDAQLWSGAILTGVRQDHLQKIAFLEQHGFRRGEYAEENMLRRLDQEIPEAPIPIGFEVREIAATGEIASRAAAQRQVWLPWTVGNVSDEEYASFMRLPGYDRHLDIVAVAPDGVIAAYVNGWIDPLNHIGDFGPVGAVLAYRRKGLTRAVLLECMRRMQGLGMDRVCVSTGVSNLPALRLYESVGFRIVNRYLEYKQAARDEPSRLDA